MKGLFITATGTDCGKTFVTAGLLRHLRAAGVPARALKPVVSGFDPASPGGSDPAVLIDAMGEAVTPAAIAAMSPLRLRAPLAPTMAARAEGVSLTLDDLLRPCVATLDAGAGPLLIEGAGGVMSPMAEGATCLELIAALRLPTLLVAGTYLGAISHTLTAYAAMQARGCAPCAIAVNESAGSEVILPDALAEFSAFLPRVPLAHIRRGETDFGPLAALCGLNEY